MTMTHVSFFARAAMTLKHVILKKVLYKTMAVVYIPSISMALRRVDCDGICLTDSDGDGICDQNEIIRLHQPSRLQLYPRSHSK